jgi:PilZ domain
MNRRKHPRFQVELRCNFSSDQIAGDGIVLDLAMEGCRMRSNTPVPPGAYVRLFITLLGQIAPLPVELAVIRWSRASQLGLEFIRIADEHQARLRHYVEDLEEALMVMVPAIPKRAAMKQGMSKG